MEKKCYIDVLEYWSLLERYDIKGSSSKHQGCCKCNVFPLSLGGVGGGDRGGVGRGVEEKASLEPKDNLPYRTHVFSRCFRVATWMRRLIG